MSESTVPTSPRILIVEDEAITAMDLAAELSNLGYEICGTVDTADEAIATALREKPQLVLMDIRLGDGGDGIEAAHCIAASLDTAVVFLTAHSDDTTLNRALAVSPYGYIVKPFRSRELKVSVDVALTKHAQQRSRTEQLSELALTDHLTGLGNRRRFDEALITEWKRASRELRPLAVLMIDIDHFKAYNDHHGHDVGDLCLQSVAHALRQHCSRPGDLVCRWGGEEFAVILPGSDSAGAAHIACDLVQKVQALAIQHGQSPIADQVTISVGSAATWPKDCENPKALLERADAALYQAKQSGRNRAVEAE